jgi:transcription-repair coupling factor (superfamily II helicase)
MGLREKKIFSDKLKKWEEYKEVMTAKETKYAKILIRLYEEKFNVLVSEFEDFIKIHDLKIIKRQNFIEADLENSLKLRIDFENPKTSEEFKFLLSIIEEKRREYFIIIKPNSNVYLPALFKERPKPHSIDQIELFIDQLIKDYEFIESKINQLNKIDFNLNFYSSDHSHNSKDILKNYKSFIEIIEILLENN